MQGSEPENTKDHAQQQVLSLAYYPNRSLNPYSCTDHTNRVLFSLIYQGLFTVSRDYEAKPMLCQRFIRSADMRIYTFYPAAATFSDGSVLTAADVCASLNAAKTSAYYGGRFQHVLSIEEVDGAVVVKLDTPYENFPILLDVPIVKAAEVNAASPLGTGPYFMDDSTQGKWLRKLQNWWCDAKLPINSAFVSLVTGVSAPQIRDEFEYSNVRLVCANPATVDFAEFRGDYELWDCESGTFLYLVCGSKGKVFTNPQLRAALTYAINRDALSDSFFNGFAHSATLPASPKSPYYSTKLAEKYAYNREIFAQALADAALTDTNVTLLVDSSDAQRLRIARAIGQMLSEFGLTVTIQEKTGTAFIDQLKWGSYDLYLAQTKLSANMDLSAFFAEKGALNYGGLADGATYAMCLESLANRGNYYKLHQMIMEEGQLCPLLFHNYAIYGARGSASDIVPARDAIFYYDSGKKLADVMVEG